MSVKKVFLVTGSNRGLGLGTVKMLLNKNISSNSNNIIITSSRNENKGKEILDELIKSFPSQKNNLDYINLDIENMTHIKLAKEYIYDKHGYISFLYNNVGYFDKSVKKNADEKEKDIIKTMSINFFSNVLLTETLITLLKSSPKACNNQILFAGSLKGQRCFNDSNLNKEFDNWDLSNLEKLYHKYLNSVYENKEEEWNYKHRNQFGSYGISKIFLNSYMKNLANRLYNNNIKVNTYNPGWVKTDMGGSKAPLSIEQGVDTIEWIVDNYNNIETGKVYENRKEALF